MKYMTLTSLFSFLMYSGVSLALLWIFTKAYIKFTPYDEIQQIGQGKKAPAFSLGGAMLGYTLPLVSLSYHGINLVDFVIWSVIAGLVQVGLFAALYRVIPLNVDEDNQAIGIFYVFSAVCVGLINAFSLIPA